ncbi:Gfo/Idh/MocA family protein [Subdoligranulum variabile]|uniref:Oxidoreductase, NAD-binding domain protein n=1 Tax=Subdoligranulum variabile DSM 15176 TaxID=411471 RepID=D1PP13_9FIRM|nr:Gfo/Idh/MocA family oxidoreductase [Subdoligranulum variabile]EFB75509.1 oxidoreductase, NAD-binding domain protein [Subdoligranulum variabile DSM 15176]UWP68959.1 Gfo/Idh/MocA family oxidoreductase [Subdoligranulum variabile]
MPLQLAVLSTSRIVEEFLHHLPEMPEISVQALCCRPQSGEKARAWAAEYGIPQVYTDEETCYRAGGFDAVYIGTANHLHYEAARRALEAGYHVILEKPFTGTAAEARALYALADQKGVMLLEAITVYYLPQFAFLRRELETIGPVRGAMASFCARSRRYDDFLKGIWNTTFDPACQGGALNDMNVYNLHLLTGLLGAPRQAEYRATRAANGIDTAGLALLDYGDFTAAALAAKDSDGVNGMVLQGPGGHLVVEGGTNALPVVYCVPGAVRGSTARREGPAAARFRMAYEFAAFVRIIAERDTAAEAEARARTLTVMDLLDKLHAEDLPQK